MRSEFDIDLNARPAKYVWPGGYPLFYFCREGYRNDETGALELSTHDREVFVCCADCLAGKNDKVAVASEVNWEDATLVCDVCSKPIESAYGEQGGGK